LFLLIFIYLFTATFSDTCFRGNQVLQQLLFIVVTLHVMHYEAISDTH